VNLGGEISSNKALGASIKIFMITRTLHPSEFDQGWNYLLKENGPQDP